MAPETPFQLAVKTPDDEQEAVSPVGVAGGAGVAGLTVTLKEETPDQKIPGRTSTVPVRLIVTVVGEETVGAVSEPEP